MYLHFNLFYALILIRIIIISYNFFIGGEVLHCDDLPSNDDATGNTRNQESSWYNNYQTKNHHYQYSTRHSDGTPLYEPYSEGLQSTSNGHRYELPDNERVVRFELPGNETEPVRNLDQFTTELDGVPVYARYHYTDMQGKDYYSYSYDGSTMIGIMEPNISGDGSNMIGTIEPTRSEIDGKGYYQGAGWTIVHKVHTSKSRRIFNKVKTTITNHIAKSNDEAIRQHNMNNKKYYEDLARAKNVIRARKTQRVNDMMRTRQDNSLFSKGVSIGSKAKKVRRFD